MRGAGLKQVMLVLAAAALAGCAFTGGVPEGARALGVYNGTLSGNVYDGPIEIEVFETAAGETLFRGRFFDPVGSGWYYFRGTIDGRAMEGKISLVFGTLSGELTADRREMSGTFRLAQNHGTWTAGKR